MDQRSDRPEIESLGGKVVGRRKVPRSGLADMTRLYCTVVALRGTPSVVPRGVYRFRSFEEADAWMIEMMRQTHARRRRKMSPESTKP